MPSSKKLKLPAITSTNSLPISETGPSNLTDVEDDFDRQAAVGRDPETIEAQINENEKFVGRVEELEHEVEELRAECEDLIENGFITENDPSKQQVENLGKQLGRLSERIKQRQDELEKTLEDVNALCHDAEQTGVTVEQLLDDISQEKPVAADINVITDQQKHLKVSQ